MKRKRTYTIFDKIYLSIIFGRLKDLRPEGRPPLKSRQQLRHQSIVHNGKELPAYEYLKKRAIELDALNVRKMDGTKVHQYETLQYWYFKNDLKGVRAYIMYLRWNYRKQQINRFSLIFKHFFNVTAD